MRRRLAISCFVAVVLCSEVFGSQVRGQLDRVRAAIRQGAEAPITGLRLRGNLRRGFSTVTARPSDIPLPVEVRIRLPDSYAVVVESRGFRTTTGCVGDAVLWAMEPLKATATGGGTPPSVREIHEQFARLSLALLAEPATAIVVRPTGDSTRTDTISFTHPNGFRAALDLATDTQLPLSLRYPDRAGVPQRPLSPAEVRRGLQLPHRVADSELVMKLADRRIVSGVSIPYLITIVADGQRLEEYRFESVEINPAFGPEDFRTR